jgi:hypothetical protein
MAYDQQHADTLRIANALSEKNLVLRKALQDVVDNCIAADEGAATKRSWNAVGLLAQNALDKTAQ